MRFTSWWRRDVMCCAVHFHTERAARTQIRMRRVSRLFGEVDQRPRSFPTGHVGSLDERRKRRGKKLPIGFVAPKKKR